MHNILLVEDSSEAYQLVSRALGTAVHLDWARSQREASDLLERKKFDLILLDVNLPDGDGFQICSLLQTHEEWSQIPVVMLTAKNSVPDRVLGFSVGADDFIAKPFDNVELKARVEAKLRKRDRKNQAADNVIHGDLEINKSSQKAFVREEGGARELDLTPLEFRLLLLLASKPNVVLSREEILNTAWGENIHVYSRSVDTHISKLRKKLGPKHEYISSVHGTGYRFSGGEKEPSPIARVSSPASHAPSLQYGRLA